ncbi:hypothetical protein [Virgibacillus indicus]|nr:hypothetical protein [Virgibacillus indicus]
MKKMIATIALGTVIVVGLFASQSSEPTELAGELEPSIFSVETPSYFF